MKFHEIWGQRENMQLIFGMSSICVKILQRSALSQLSPHVMTACSKAWMCHGICDPHSPMMHLIYSTIAETIETGA